MLGWFTDFVSQCPLAVGDDAFCYFTDGIFDPHSGLGAQGVFSFTVRLNPALFLQAVDLGELFSGTWLVNGKSPSAETIDNGKYRNKPYRGRSGRVGPYDNNSAVP